MSERWEQYLAELRPDVEKLMADRLAFSREHQRRRCELPPDQLRIESLRRLRGLAFEAMGRWGMGNQLESFLQLSIIDAHDAAVDAISAVDAGAGPASIALVRRLYELCLILTAGWLNQSGLETAMTTALRTPFADDRYAAAAGAGLLGAVMPKPNVLRISGLRVIAIARRPEHSPKSKLDSHRSDIPVCLLRRCTGMLI